MSLGAGLYPDLRWGIGVNHLTTVHYQPPAEAQGHPFAVPVIRTLERLEFEAPVTFLVGENGSGKSTLLEALAVAAGLPVAGGDSLESDPTLDAARRLAGHLKLSWKRRTHRGFFLRAEDFFNFCKSLSLLRAELKDDLENVDRSLARSSEYARQLARGVYRGNMRALERAYGENLDANSHGESFLKLFQARMVPDGLYLLDEPEAPLSPARQLALLSLLMAKVQEGCQFIVATHSPILMALPGAVILSFDEVPVRSVGYDELEHVRITRDFLRNPERYLRHL